MRFVLFCLLLLAVAAVTSTTARAQVLVYDSVVETFDEPNQTDTDGWWQPRRLDTGVRFSDVGAFEVRISYNRSALSATFPPGDIRPPDSRVFWLLLGNDARTRTHFVATLRRNQVVARLTEVVRDTVRTVTIPAQAGNTTHMRWLVEPLDGTIDGAYRLRWWINDTLHISVASMSRALDGAAPDDTLVMGHTLTLHDVQVWSNTLVPPVSASSSSSSSALVDATDADEGQEGGSEFAHPDDPDPVSSHTTANDTSAASSSPPDDAGGSSTDDGDNEHDIHADVPSVACYHLPSWWCWCMFVLVLTCLLTPYG